MDDALLARRFGLIEQRLLELYEHLGIPYPPSDGDGASQTGETPAGPQAAAASLPPEVVELAQAGHTTDAISRLRHLTGMTLLEAKRAVESLDGS